MMTDLSSALGTSGRSGANGINTHGDVVGYTANGAFVYSNGATQNFGAAGSQAVAINDSGFVVGTSNPAQCSSTCNVFTYSNGTLTPVAPIAFTPTIAVGVTASGGLVGTTAGVNNPSQGFVYENGTTRYLTPHSSDPNAPTSLAAGANAAGDVVGALVSQLFAGPTQAALFSRNGTVTVLGGLAPDKMSIADAVNANGEIVGWAADAQSRDVAFLYENGQMADLNDLVQSSPLAAFVRLTGASAINDDGWIVANGIDSRTGQSHAYLIENPAPVPLPAGIWLLGSALLGIRLTGVKSTSPRFPRRFRRVQMLS
jgi:probable HAF family extracellular repeat protein